MSKRILIALALLALCGALASGAAAQPPAPDPKVVFDLRVALEWEPGSSDNLATDLAHHGCDGGTPMDARYLKDLEAGLRRAAAYLYRYSEGQMALGTVTVTTGGEDWDRADIRILANSAYRPTAFVGGIVDQPTSYISSTTGRVVTFQPGQIFLSRLWDGDGSRCGPWSGSAGWRTIGHEWGHYALFLWDEYMNQRSQGEQYCTNTGDASRGLDIRDRTASSREISTTFSLMGYHYRADKLTPAGTARESCRNTPQMHVHGATDWETIKRFYPVASVDDVSIIVDFEHSAAKDLLVFDMPPAERVTESSAQVKLAPLDEGEVEAQAYIVRRDGTERLTRILGQGELTTGGDPLVFWGVADGVDRPAVLAQNWKSGERYYASTATSGALQTGTTNEVVAAPSAWRPSVSIAPTVSASGLQGLRVRVKDCTRQEQSPAITLVYCPAGGDCGAPVVVPDMLGTATYSYTFTFSPKTPPAAHGYIYARSGFGEETIAWYQRAGGLGPAHADQHAPLLDAHVSVDLEADEAIPDSAQTHVIYSPAQRCTTKEIPFAMPAKVKRIVGTPFEIQPILGTVGGGRGWGSLAGDPPLAVRLSYSQDLLDRLGVDENQLVLLRLSDTKWSELPVAGRSTALDWIAAAPQPFGGSGEVYALGYRVPTSWLPLTALEP